MILIRPSTLLRRTLQVQALGNGVAGLAALLAGAGLSQRLDLPAGVLAAASVYLLGISALCIRLSGRSCLPRSMVWALTGFNALFAFASIVLLALGLSLPNLLGTLVICAEAWIALAFGELLQMGLRRSPRIAGQAWGSPLQGQ
ncbi:hypothetical protein [Geminicoccus roseus]|uniref:hypothetical protein n=1 Tax=Geminicoccus roseus TaxID=404900 RepID=UPI00041273D9|nr:hypothetical protein [Geminicoccus roseus]